MGESIPSTCFPAAGTLAQAWDPELCRQTGEALGRECAAEQVAVVLGPGINIKRNPLCGRNFEYFSEDPLLTGVLAAAFIRGVQSLGVGTSLKHFTANNQEFFRMVSDTRVDEATLREIYLPAFERAVQAQPWTVMCAYNRLNGVYCSDNHYLLTPIAIRSRYTTWRRWRAKLRVDGTSESARGHVSASRPVGSASPESKSASAPPIACPASPRSSTHGTRRSHGNATGAPPRSTTTSRGVAAATASTSAFICAGSSMSERS